MTRDIHIQGESDKCSPYFSQKQSEKKIPIIKIVKQIGIYTMMILKNLKYLCFSYYQL